MNKRNKADVIIILGFSTLRTTVPQNELLKGTYEFINYCFDGSNNTYANVIKFGTKWISDLLIYPSSFGAKTFKKTR